MAPSWYLFVAIAVLIAVFWPFPFAYTTAYVFAGCLVLGWLWGRFGRTRTLVGFTVSHPRVFFGEKADIALAIRNRSFLPLPWVDVSVRLPLAFQEGGILQRLVSVPRRGELRMVHQIECATRGLYSLGPVTLRSSDIFGFGSWVRECPDVLKFVVYPKIYSLQALGIPARQPLGILRTGYRIFEDTTRFASIRDYVPGDPIKRVDWKATARTRTLQVRTYDPTITMSTAVFLDLDRTQYDFKFSTEYLELAISVTASIVNHIAGLGQEVSLATNGIDPLGEAEAPSSTASPAASGTATPEAVKPGPSGGNVYVPLQKGQGQLVRILELLARIKPSEGQPFLEVLTTPVDWRIPWGATLVFVVPKENPDLLLELLARKRAGHNVVLMILHPTEEKERIKAKCQSQGIVAHFIEKEEDLDVFRVRRRAVA